MKLTFGIWCQPLSQHPLPRAWHQPNLLIPFTNTLSKIKAKKQEMRFYSRKILSYCLGLRTQKQGLKQVDLGPISLMGSDKINILK